jgi:hypothetical protein
MNQPTAEAAASFVRNLQFLLTEGEFVSTYKFALLIALARWALEHADWDEARPLDIEALAPHFAALYWPHVQPFQARRGGDDRDWAGVLIQDRGQTTARQVPRVLKLIRNEHDAGSTRFDDLPLLRRTTLMRQVARSIREMPLWRLQRVRNQDEPVRFLYRKGPTQSTIVFEPGIVRCLAGFAPLVEQVVRAAWLRFVLQYNAELLGASAQVEAFLFPVGREALDVWRPALTELQAGRCFYCEREMRDATAVDHFLPWSRYPRDLGHNFVLAHVECNGAKSDHLAAGAHLRRWCERNAEHGEQLTERFQRDRLPADWPTSWQVARSLYAIADASGAQVWLRERLLAPLDSDWDAILLAHRPAD